MMFGWCRTRKSLLLPMMEEVVHVRTDGECREIEKKKKKKKFLGFFAVCEGEP